MLYETIKQNGRIQVSEVPCQEQGRLYVPCFPREVSWERQITNKGSLCGKGSCAVEPDPSKIWC